MTGPRLDMFVDPMRDWSGSGRAMANAVDGYEDRRQLLYMPDAFIPTFELGPDAQHAWSHTPKPSQKRTRTRRSDQLSGRRAHGDARAANAQRFSIS